jgi:hypothetical protein
MGLACILKVHLTSRFRRMEMTPPALPLYFMPEKGWYRNCMYWIWLCMARANSPADGKTTLFAKISMGSRRIK